MFIKLFILAFVVFFAVDMLWLGLIAKNLYQRQLGHLLSSDVNWLAAIIFYLLFIFGIVYFVLYPNVDQSVGKVILSGALFGLIAYATYDLTNLATMKDWPIQITLIDLAWGTFLGASTSTIVFYLYHLIF